MKTFKDLRFIAHPLWLGLEDDKFWGGGKQAKLTFANGHDISVIFGSLFYSNGVDTYEAYPSCDEEPTGYLTKQGVTKLMKRVQNMPVIKQST